MREIKRVACIGAGIIGQGWATVFSSNGLEVILQDREDHILQESLKHIQSNLRFLESHGILSKGGADISMKRISTTQQVSNAVEKADYVQESVPDSYDLKRQIFKEMDAAAPSHAVLASSASGLLMTEIQTVTTIPQRCVLAHPMLPVHILPGVEIVGGDMTLPETIELTRKFFIRLGKTPIMLNREVPGYIVNRLQAAMLREAIDLVDKGIASPEEIDKAYCKGTGFRAPFVGPFLRMHIAGNGIENFIANYAQSYHFRWETMESWTSISASAADAVIKGARKMETIREKSLEETKLWRDEKLIKLMRLFQEDERQS